jgi:DNA-binding IclR family transcriptional regulator
VIAGSVQRGLRHHMRPYMERLCKEIDETIDLAMLEGGEALFVDQYVAVHGLRVVAHMGARLPLHCTASGKALLAAVGPERAAEVLRPPLAAYTRNTIVNMDRLQAELDRIVQTGVAYDREEYLEGVCAVATPVRDATGGVAALTIEMPVARFIANERQIVAALVRCRDQAQQHLLGGPQTMAAQTR